MIASLLKRLMAPSPAELPATDARIALAALLVRIARSDGDYAEVEIEQIRRVLARRYGLDKGAVGDLLMVAENLERDAPDTVRFTRAIKDAVPYEERTGVVRAAWAVVLADGERSREENALMRLIASLLGVNDRDSAIARHRAERETG
ncbi:MAG TPA: TerB family tellurite resistance protein [Rhodobacteraceae bacterium]|nr:TerB family tellurite resistance protein [Paracoccaceae bacterium]